MGWIVGRGSETTPGGLLEKYAERGWLGPPTSPFIRRSSTRVSRITGVDDARIKDRIFPKSTLCYRRRNSSIVISFFAGGNTDISRTMCSKMEQRPPGSISGGPLVCPARMVAGADLNRPPSGYEFDDHSLSPIDSVALTPMRPPKSPQKGQVLDPSWTLELR